MGVSVSGWEWVGARFSITHFIIACHIHMYKESTFCNFLTVKELLVRDRQNIRRLTDFNSTRTNNHVHGKKYSTIYANWANVPLQTKSLRV